MSNASATPQSSRAPSAVPLALKVGSIIRNPKAPQWGRGEVVAVDLNGAKLHAIFEHESGNQARVLHTAGVTCEPAADGGPPMRHLPTVKKVGTHYVLDQKAVRRTLPELWEFFERCFPDGGFADAKYLGTGQGKHGTGERDYKVAANQLLVDSVLSDEGRGLVNSGNGDEVSQRLRALVRKTNLLPPQETNAFGDSLKAGDVALDYARALLQFVDAPKVDSPAFAAYRDAVLRLPQTGKLPVGTWPVLTLLPFLAQPDRHMFLKPVVTQLAAQVLGEGIQVQVGLNWVTYKRLLDFTADLMVFLKSHGARDYIDVQSFLWVVATYTPPASGGTVPAAQ